MSYNSILKKLVENSNLTYAQIIEEFKKHTDKSMDKSYLSRLVNSDLTPSDEVSGALEKVFNTKRNMLIVESYLEKAPQIMKDFINTIRDSTIAQTISIMNIQDNKEIVNALTDEIYNLPAIEILEAATQHKNNDEIKLFNGNNKSIEIHIGDNGFAPIVPMGASVQIESSSEYQNGDVIAVKIDEDTPVVVRKYLKLSDAQIVLIPANFDKEPLICSREQVAILGKVTSYRTNID